MAFERMMNGDEDLQKQLERQLGDPPTMPSQNWQSYADKGTAPASMTSGGAVQAPQPQNQSPLMERVQVGRGADGQVTMDQVPAASQPSMANAAPKTGGALARYGTGDIADAKGLKTGGYGGEGFSYESRAAAGERGADTIKNSFGKIASRYDPTQAGASKAVMADPDFQRLFPEARLVEHPNGDMIDFGDGKPVDVLRAARAGGAGEAWQWGADDGGGGAQQMGGMDINSLVAGIGSGADPMAAIQAQIAAASNGQDEQTLIQQLLAQQGI